MSPSMRKTDVVIIGLGASGGYAALALTQAGRAGRAPFALTDGGFHRLQAGRSVLIVDCGPPPPAVKERVTAVDHTPPAGLNRCSRAHPRRRRRSPPKPRRGAHSYGALVQ